MTPFTRIFQGMASCLPCAWTDRDRRLRETTERVDQADELFGRSQETFYRSSGQLRDVKDSYIAAMRQLSDTLDTQ